LQSVRRCGLLGATRSRRNPVKRFLTLTLFALTLALQGLSQAIKSLAMLTMLRVGRRRAAKAAG